MNQLISFIQSLTEEQYTGGYFGKSLTQIDSTGIFVNKKIVYASSMNIKCWPFQSLAFHMARVWRAFCQSSQGIVRFCHSKVWKAKTPQLMYTVSVANTAQDAGLQIFVKKKSSQNTLKHSPTLVIRQNEEANVWNFFVIPNSCSFRQHSNYFSIVFT